MINENILFDKMNDKWARIELSPLLQEATIACTIQFCKIWLSDDATFVKCNFFCELTLKRLLLLLSVKLLITNSKLLTYYYKIFFQLWGKFGFAHFCNSVSHFICQLTWTMQEPLTVRLPQNEAPEVRTTFPFESDYYDYY